MVIILCILCFLTLYRKIKDFKRPKKTISIKKSSFERNGELIDELIVTKDSSTKASFMVTIDGMENYTLRIIHYKTVKCELLGKYIDLKKRSFSKYGYIELTCERTEYTEYFLIFKLMSRIGTAKLSFQMKHEGKKHEDTWNTIAEFDLKLI